MPEYRDEIASPRVVVYVSDNKNTMTGISVAQSFERRDKVAFIKIALYEGPRMKKYRDIIVKLRDDIDIIDLDVLTVDEDLQ